MEHGKEKEDAGCCMAAESSSRPKDADLLHMVTRLIELQGHKIVQQFPTETLLLELIRRGGATGQLASCAVLCERKAQDYQAGVTRDDYFPLGQASYTQMVHVKAARLLSLTQKPGRPNFEGILDTLKDIINYASFNLDWLSRKDDTKDR